MKVESVTNDLSHSTSETGRKNYEQYLKFMLNEYLPENDGCIWFNFIK